MSVARLAHRLVVATVRASPHRLPDGRWTISVSLTARGRSMPRPLTPVALRLPRLRERALEALADPRDTP
ncbi:hypothetical protein [Streptomyces niveus]|uniref:hypothetical protein n=1 Tax=Streptomyces niveus TaxID=193462 RepID=UPI003658F9E6